MTHPDDEISVCQLIHQLVRAGAEVFIAWSHSIEVRENEARAAAGLLGVPQEHLRFFGAADQQVCDELSRLAPVFKEMIRDISPTRVVCGAFEQGHIDHDATNFLVNQAFDGLVLEVPFYHTYTTRLQSINRFSDPQGEEVLHLDRDAIRFKKEFARQYPSQNIWSVLLAYEAWQAVRGRKVELAKSERVRPQTHRDFRSPNHPQRLRERVKVHPTWHRWLSALEAFEAR